MAKKPKGFQKGHPYMGPPPASIHSIAKPMMSIKRNLSMALRDAVDIDEIIRVLKSFALEGMQPGPAGMGRIPVSDQVQLVALKMLLDRGWGTASSSESTEALINEIANRMREREANRFDVEAMSPADRAKLREGLAAAQAAKRAPSANHALPEVTGEPEPDGEFEDDEDDEQDDGDDQADPKPVIDV